MVLGLFGRLAREAWQQPWEQKKASLQRPLKVGLCLILPILIFVVCFMLKC